MTLPAYETYPVTIGIQRGWQIAPDGILVVPLVDEYSFLVRTLSRREFRLWTSQFPHPDDFEDHLIRETVLRHPPEFRGRPWDWNEVFAGIAQRVVQEVLALSGFAEYPHPEIIGRTEAYLASPESHYDLLIMAAFDGYRLHELEDLSSEQFQKLVSQAQRKLYLIGLDPQAILDPEGYAQKLKKQNGANGIRKGVMPQPGMGEGKAVHSEMAMSFGDLG